MAAGLGAISPVELFQSFIIRYEEFGGNVFG